MHKQYSENEKRQLITEYHAGKSVSIICTESNVPKSTIYSWIKSYKVLSYQEARIIPPNSGFLRELDSLKRRNNKLERIITVLKSVNCTTSSELQVKLKELELLHGQFSVHVLCEALDVPRGTYYNHIKRNLRNNSTYIKRRESLRTLIQEVYDESQQVYGSKKIRAVLSNQGHAVSDNMVAELMQEMGLFSIRTQAKRDYKKLNGYDKKSNILRRRFTAERPDQVWMSDVTYFKLSGKLYFICVIIDLYSRKVIAHKISLRNNTHLITSTFKLAYSYRNPSDKLLFHSDRGAPFTSYSFRNLLKGNNIQQSFSNPGRPHDNAVTESFFANLKREELYRKSYRSKLDFENGVNEFIIKFNTERPHASLNYKTPEQYEKDIEK